MYIVSNGYGTNDHRIGMLDLFLFILVHGGLPIKTNKKGNHNHQKAY